MLRSAAGKSWAPGRFLDGPGYCRLQQAMRKVPAQPFKPGCKGWEGADAGRLQLIVRWPEGQVAWWSSLIDI